MKLLCVYVFFFFFSSSSPTWCLWAWRIQGIWRLCGAAAVVAAVHNVLFCQTLSSICSWRIGVKLLAQLPPYLWSWSLLVTHIQYTQPGGRGSVIPSNPREINYATSQPLWFLSSPCLANASNSVDDGFNNLKFMICQFFFLAMCKQLGTNSIRLGMVYLSLSRLPVQRSFHPLPILCS